ncbi:mannosyltransferase [Tamlana sp. 2_MG-2023]|uniref:mannosyltransferase n=1 Tax=unclassified Tamlana TaxID=2614803 RepID=UPI0026E38448|nr:MULTISPECIES: mannosyltransferase [unclassified Tamlana]MDO6760932.1 mannosyltransferase [Tamlana sp. 2_MG-2023]MDO6791188.1 mannosyltransferase [Tamlana sp. 1_MG-2023]
MHLNASFLKLNKTPILLGLSCLLFYWAFAYNLVRTDYIKLISLYTALFFLFYKLVQLLKGNTKALTYLAFAFRAIFICAIPNLSQDFHRFIWDGRLILEGINPYLNTVNALITEGHAPVAQALELQKGMGNLNASHFSNYPPINQLCFAIAALISSKSILGAIVTMRLLIIAADFGTLYFGKKLLEKLQLPSYLIFWYVLNPFIIIELTGNLHFEGVMIFFLIWSLYLLHIGKWQWAAVVFSLSISVKLIPLIFLPLFYQWFIKRSTSERAQHIPVTPSEPCPNSKIINEDNINQELNTFKKGLFKLITFYVIIGFCTLLLFAPFYSSEFINNYATTVALWFQNFEFNGSLYYIAREIGYTFRGYNEIAFIGKGIAILVVFIVLGLTFFRKNKNTVQLITAMLFALSFYYFTATTVHPWYVATLLILSVFTKYKFPLVWSFVIILSYLAYLNSNQADKSENLWVIALEYAVVYAVFIWEVFIKKAPKTEAL